MQDNILTEDTNLSNSEEFDISDLYEEDTNPQDNAADDDSVDDDSNDDGEEGGKAEQDAAGDTNAALPLKIPVTFLGKEMELTAEEAAALAQKGLNYDHIKAKADTLETKLTQLESRSLEGQKKTQLEELKAQGYPEEIANELITLRAEKAQREREEAAQQAEKQAEEKRQQVLADFIKEYPDVSPKDWPDEMRQAYAQGRDIVAVYRAIENKKLKDEIQALKQNKTNKEKSIGTVKGTGAAKTDSDPFLAGLFG